MKPLVLACVLAVALTSATWVSVRADAPKPAPTAISWELQVDLSEPHRLQVDTGAGPRIYWYVLYTVTNNTGRDVAFSPEIVRVSEIENETSDRAALDNPAAGPKLTVSPSLMPHPIVFKKIKSIHAKTHPFLVTPVKAIGNLLQGRENARTSVAIFPELDARVSRFTYYFSGLSGEKIVRRNPMYKKAKAGETKSGPAARKLFVLRKTLAVPYVLPGDVNTRRSALPVLGRMTWVMR